MQSLYTTLLLNIKQTIAIIFTLQKKYFPRIFLKDYFCEISNFVLSVEDDVQLQLNLFCFDKQLCLLINGFSSGLSFKSAFELLLKSILKCFFLRTYSMFYASRLSTTPTWIVCLPQHEA